MHRAAWTAIVIMAVAMAYTCCIGTSVLSVATVASRVGNGPRVPPIEPTAKRRAALTPFPSATPALPRASEPLVTPAPDDAAAFAERALATLAPAETAMETVRDDVRALANGRSTDVLGLYVDTRRARDRFEEAASSLACLAPPAGAQEVLDELRAYALDQRDACSALMKWLVGRGVDDLAAYESALDAAAAHRAAGLARLTKPAASR